MIFSGSKPPPDGRSGDHRHGNIGPAVPVFGFGLLRGGTFFRHTPLPAADMPAAPILEVRLVEGAVPGRLPRDKR